MKAVVENQWEVCYIDDIPSVELWKQARDFSGVPPGLFPVHTELDGLLPEASTIMKAYEITPQRGRLRVAANPAFFAGEEKPSLLVNTTARWPIAANSPASFKDHMDIGHIALGEAFAGLTSDRAKRFLVFITCINC